MTNRSAIHLELVGREWMVVQQLNADDARAVAYALGMNDLAARDLFEAADEIDAKNGVEL